MFYGCLSFFNEKYRYFATFDKQILAEKLVFRILQHRFSRGSAISKMIVVNVFERFQNLKKEGRGTVRGYSISYIPWES